MKAVFTLIPEESKRLIAKAIVQLEEVKIAKEKAYIILNAGTTNAYIVQELLGMTDMEPHRFVAGLNTKRLVCVSDPDKRLPFPVILFKGELSPKTIPEALQDFRKETLLIKGGNAIDHEGNVGLILGGFDGGGTGAALGIVVSQGLKYIVPVGLEKMVPSVKEAAAWTGAKTFDYAMGADFGILCIPNAKVITEIQALKILTGVEARHVASGGIGESAGAVVLVIQGETKNVKKAISLIESIKGEPRLKDFKGTCEKCRYACLFAGKREEDLPLWLRD